ncbi:MAG: acetyl ornithine aminotransferase family protein [Actinomycetota bacterium]
MPAAYDELAAVVEPRVTGEVPGPNARMAIESDREVTSPSLPRAYEFVPARGAGAVLEDVDGNVFLDFNAGIAVCSTGHAHPDVTEAIADQAARLLHYSASDFYLPIYAEMCRRLDSIAPMSGPARSFLTNSGTEAVEAAIKLARYATHRGYVIGFFGSFHGRSYGSVSVTASSAKYKRGFGPMLPGVVHAPYADSLYSYTDGADASGYIENILFKRLVPPDEVAAIIFEPVLGEGGYVVPQQAWVRGLRDLCDQHGILLVADEVQSGMGRTGKMWAIEHFEVEPDIILSGKGIASGLPLGAMTARSELMKWEPGAHGSTYGGNPVACAAGLVTIDLIEKELIANADAVGAQLREGLAPLTDHHVVTDVRGLGLMIGIEFSSEEIADRVETECFRRGLLVLRAGDRAIRMSPPLVINSAQATTGLRIFREVVGLVNG